MNFDKKSLSNLLSLNDEEMIKVIKEIGKEAGVPPEKLNVGKADILKIRAFLSMASDDDIAHLVSQFGGKKQ